MTHDQLTMEKEQNLSFASVTENISLVERLINQICSDYKVSEDHYGNMLVALTEAVNNAIMHGNKSNPEKIIAVHFSPEGTSKLSFTIKDQGDGFDFDSLPDPTNPENLEKPNGRGVFLMRHLADKVEFSDNGSTVTLHFNISAN
jgi:serine/threonine-protein kinase RsbW